MYLADTNVISEFRKISTGRADRNFTAWSVTVPTEAMHLSVMTLHELDYGILLKERRDAGQGAMFRGWFETQVIPAFSGRILPITETVARKAAALSVPDPMPVQDSFIAATALVHGLVLATRNAADFRRTGVALLNPWDWR